MLKVSQHIAYLLLSCRKVSVPKLGTFSAYYQKATFDAFDGVFYPSRIRIIFSQELSDSLLLSTSLTRKMNIKETESFQMIEDFVSLVTYKLQRNGYCRLEGIGYLVQVGDKICLRDTFWERNKYLRHPSVRV